jgi:cytochrome P450
LFFRGLLQDAKVFPQPSVFLPERFLTLRGDGTWELRTNVIDPRTYAFGFGRRVCPGKHIAEQSLFATVSTVAHTLKVLRAKDSFGHEVIPDAKTTSGFLCHPIPFAYELHMREDAERLVKLCAEGAEQ